MRPIIQFSVFIALVAFGVLFFGGIVVTDGIIAREYVIVQMLEYESLNNEITTLKTDLKKKDARIKLLSGIIKKQQKRGQRGHHHPSK